MKMGEMVKPFVDLFWLPEQSTMFWALSADSVPRAKAAAPSKAPIAANA